MFVSDGNSWLSPNYFEWWPLALGILAFATIAPRIVQRNARLALLWLACWLGVLAPVVINVVQVPNLTIGWKIEVLLVLALIVALGLAIIGATIYWRRDMERNLALLTIECVASGAVVFAVAPWLAFFIVLVVGCAASRGACI